MAHEMKLKLTKTELALFAALLVVDVVVVAVSRVIRGKV